MNKWQILVMDFHLKFGYEVYKKPTYLNIQSLNFRIELMKEELNELIISMYKGDMIGIADGLGDLLYVVIGTGVSCGIDLNPVFYEIHRSNMSKDVSKSGIKKAIKGKNYFRPKIKEIIEVLRK